MARVKRGKITHKKREKLLKKVKGFKAGRKKRYRLAKQALVKALTYAYRHRKEKKRNFRKLWQAQINAACQKFGISYSKFIHGLKEKKIELNRKILANLAQNHPEIFEKIVKTISQ
jgi:large subunit ribosomal protein L20